MDGARPRRGVAEQTVLTTGCARWRSQTLRSIRRTEHFAGGPQGRPGKMWSESTFTPNAPPGSPLWPPCSASWCRLLGKIKGRTRSSFPVARGRDASVNRGRAHSHLWHCRWLLRRTTPSCLLAQMGNLSSHCGNYSVDTERRTLKRESHGQHDRRRGPRLCSARW